MSFLIKIEENKDEMVKFLKSLLTISSVKGPPNENAPFGAEISKALDYVLSWGEREGFKCKNLSGYAGHIEYGEGEETVGVLVHLDVVPAGEGWTYAPFSGTIKEGRIYGRGTIDDKGPAVAAMFALKALKDAKIKLGKKIRLIFGCDEESGWACMDYYFKHESKPDVGFAPDADFPLINCEKGMLGFDLNGKILLTDSQPRILKFQGGTRRNVVPDYAEAVILAGDCEVKEKEVLSLYFTQVAKSDAKFKWEENADRYVLKTYGVSAHASLPHLGDNAITKMASILEGMNIKGGTWDVINFIAQNLRRENSCDGKNLGIDCRDEISGELTLNLGVINMEEEQVHLELDIRYPLCGNDQYITDKIQEKVRPLNLSLKPQHSLKPHYVPLEEDLVQVLLNAYRSETQDYSGPIAIGGRTYAVTLGNGVAFGPAFPGRPELAHQKDEYILLQDFYSCARIYARALYDLAKNKGR